MGIPLLLRKLQDNNGRVSLLEDITNKDDGKYKTAIRIATKGRFNSIGIDESVFLHGHTKDNDSVDQNAYHVALAIEHYITCICNFFEYYRRLVKDKEGIKEDEIEVEEDEIEVEEDEIEVEEEEEKENTKKKYNGIKIFLSVDGPPPVKKNRRKMKNKEYELDAYSKMPLDEKRKLQSCIAKKLQQMLSKKKNYKFNIQSNHEEYEPNNLSSLPKEEGEIELIKFAKSQERQTTNVILSSDSDVTAMVILNKMENIVIVAPKCSCNCPYISDLQSISSGLELNYDQLITYVILHFIFFGSDYNYGLMNCATETKKKLIYQASIEENIDIDSIGQKCIRARIRSAKFCSYDDAVIMSLKNLLIVEAICSIKYYASLGKMKHLLTEASPLIYLKCQDDDNLDIGHLVSLLKF